MSKGNGSIDFDNHWNKILCKVSSVSLEDTLTKFSLRGNREQSIISELCLLYLKSKDYVKSFRVFEFCQLFVWEKLNTGHWSEVDVVWQQLYQLVAVLKVISIINIIIIEGKAAEPDETLFQELLKMCDMGLLLGGSVCQNICSKITDELANIYNALFLFESDQPPEKKLCQEIKSQKVPKHLMFNDPNIELAEELSFIDFIQRYKMLKKPVVITGLMDDWPAMSDQERRWSVESIRARFGCRSVPVELGKRYTDDDWTQSIMTIKEFIDQHVLKNSETKGYLAQHQLLDQIEGMKDDIIIPEFCYSGNEEEIDINSWFGPAGTISPLHTDPKHNILCQVFGSKYIKLYDQSQTPYLYPHDSSKLLSNTSQIDIENWDQTSFPDFSKAKGYNCVLKRGEMLYIPPLCWHYVRSLSPSFSVSFWFQ